MPQKRPASRTVRRIDPAALAEFQAGIRKRYSNEQILEQLRACAERLGRSPTMREFAADGRESLDRRGRTFSMIPSVPSFGVTST